MAQGSLTSSPGPGLGCIALGLAFAALGLVLAFDYRGLTTKQANVMFRLMPMRQPVETRRVGEQVTLSKAAGVILAIVGAGTVVLGAVGFIGWLA